ncbi:MAG TPA: hypothetical protein VHB79_00100 [Polyangiaceae bacterium]|nr:hypothetical protein [Polyangiaceae bacterium]
MSASVTVWARSSDFQRSLLALRYFFGTRGESLADALGELPLQPAAADVLRRLCHTDRPERAKALAGELGRLSTALDERGLWR